MEKRYTRSEVAKKLGLNMQTIWYLMEEGHFPNHGKCECGRSIMFSEEDIKKEIKLRKNKSTKIKKLAN